jgi:hypothetical protein
MNSSLQATPTIVRPRHKGSHQLTSTPTTYDELTNFLALRPSIIRRCSNA